MVTQFWLGLREGNLPSGTSAYHLHKSLTNRFIHCKWLKTSNDHTVIQSASASRAPNFSYDVC